MIGPLLLLYVSLIVFLGFNKKYQSSIIFCTILALLLVLIATYRSPSSPDYGNYMNLYDYEFENKEIGFLALIKISKWMSKSPLLYFFLSAVLSISLKVFAIRKISPFIGLSLIVYISNVFMLHDMIQMRCAISSGLLLWSLYFYCSNDKIKSLVISSIAVVFHYSAVIIFFIYLLDRQKFNKGVAVVLLVFSYILALSGYGFGTLWGYIPWGEFARLWNTYSDMMATGEMNKINLFSAFFVTRFGICMALILYYDKIRVLGDIYIAGLKMYVISICMYLLFSDVPILAFRLSELFQVVEVFLVSSMVLLFDSRSFGRFFVICITTAFLLINIFYNELVI